jgi:DNA-binding response OmpR family regulator
MRVLVLGNDILAQRLSSTLGVDGIEVAHLVELPLALDLIRQDKFDLVVVDNLIENVDIICNCIYGLACTPVVLILEENTADWRMVSYLKVDGFLLKETSDSELRARVKAACHRPVKLSRIGLMDSAGLIKSN